MRCRSRWAVTVLGRRPAGPARSGTEPCRAPWSGPDLPAGSGGSPAGTRCPETAGVPASSIHPWLLHPRSGLGGAAAVTPRGVRDVREISARAHESPLLQLLTSG